MVNYLLLMALRNQNWRIATFRAFLLSVMALIYVILTEKVNSKKTLFTSCGSYFYPKKHGVMIYKGTKKLIHVVNVEFLFKVDADTFSGH